MLYTRLNDAGDGFEPQRNVIQKRPGLDGGGSIAADAEGNVYVAWHAPNVNKGEVERPAHDPKKGHTPAHAKGEPGEADRYVGVAEGGPAVGRADVEHVAVHRLAVEVDDVGDAVPIGGGLRLDPAGGQTGHVDESPVRSSGVRGKRRVRQPNRGNEREEGA